MQHVRQLIAIAAGVALAAITGTGSAIAATALYTDRASFDTAAGATTTLDFEAQDTTGTNTYYGSTLTVGDVTFTQPNNRLFVFNENFYPTNGLTSNYLSQNCCAPSGLNVSFANPVYSVGMDIGHQEDWTGLGNFQIDFTLSTGDAFSITAPLLYNTTNTMDFIGFSSDVAFSSFSMLAPSEGIAIDDFSYTTSPAGPPSTVPLPASILFFAPALAALALRRKSRA